MGTIMFAYPTKVAALQAADVIAWGVHRRLMAKPFNQGFEFIENIINAGHHVQQSWEESDLQDLAKRLMKYRDQNH